MTNATDRPKLRVSGIKGCSRCGGDHEEVEASEMSRPFAPPEAGGLIWTHWFACPTNGDPVLLICSAEGEAPEGA